MREGLTPDDLRFTPPRLSVDLLASFLRERWGIEGDFVPLSGERDQNFRVRTPGRRQYVLKASSPIEDPTLVDFQTCALLRIEQYDASLPIPRIVRSLRHRVCEVLVDADGAAYPVRLLSFVSGAPLGRFAPPSLDTITQIGALQGRMCQALAGFEHAAAGHFMPWDILNGLVVSKDLRTRYLQDGLALICAPHLERLEHTSLERMLRLPHQVIHNDAHSGNVMVDPANPARVTGIIDFGDLVHRPILVDLSTSLASILERAARPLAAAAALVQGFQRLLPIPEQQLELLYDAVVARAIMTVQLLQFRLENTSVDAHLRDTDLPNCKAGLRRILRIEEKAFLDAVLHPEHMLSETG